MPLKPLPFVGGMAGKPLPEFEREEATKPLKPLPPINLGERLPSTPEASSTVGGWGDLIQELGWDVALIIGAGAVAGGAVSVAFPPSAPFIGGAFGKAILGSTLTGLTYGAAKEAQRALGAPKEPTISEQIIGKEIHKGPLAPITRTAEEGLFWAGFPVVGKALKPVGKPLIKGVQRVMRAEPLKPVAEAVWDNVIVKPFKIPVPYMDKTVQELFQPAIERIRKNMPKVGGTFREARTQESLVRGTFKRLARERQTLLPTEQMELIEGLIGKPIGELTSGRVKDMVRRVEEELLQPGMTARYRSAVKPQYQKLMYGPLEEVESAYSSEVIRKKFKTFEKVLKGKEKIKPKHIYGLLDEIIHNPRVPKKMQDFAKDLYNVPAQTSVDVAKASTHATTEYILADLKKTRGIISRSMRPGYVMSKHPSLKEAYIPKDIELELQAMRQIPKLALQTYNRWFMSPWKTNKVILRPATHFRNMLSNLILNDWGGLPFWRMDLYMKAAGQLKNKGPIYRDWVSMMGETGRFATEEVAQLQGALRYGDNMFHKALNVYDTIAAPARSLYGAEETWFKLAKYMHNLEKGLPKVDAALDAMKWTFNYGEITPFVGAIRQYVAPFATWQTKVIPLMAETAVKHPLRFGKWIAFGYYMQDYAIQNVGLSEGEWESIQRVMPEYMQKGLYLLMPWRDDEGQLKQLNLTWMIPGIGDVAEILQRGERDPLTWFIQNPILSTIAGLQSKKKYSGAPLYYDWEPFTTKMAKSAGFIWEMWSPAPAPGNIDFRSLWDAIQERPEALSAEEAIAGQFGFRLTTVNPMLIQKRKRALERIHESEMSTQMKKELRRAKNSEEKRRIIEKYRAIRIKEAQP